MLDVVPATEADLPEVWDLHVRSRDELIVRMGATPPPPGEPIARDLRRIFAADPEGFWLGREGGRLKGFACAIVRGPVWFLSSFWVEPGDQGRGIGRPLLEQAVGYGDRLGARTRTVWASLDTRAQHSYLKVGMEPRFPLYRVQLKGAARERFARRAEGTETCQPGPAEAAVLEAPAWGAWREGDHAAWAGDPDFVLHGTARGGRLAGFAAIRKGSFLGPAAGLDQEALVAAVARAAGSVPGDLVLRVPGAAMTLLAALLADGARVLDLALYMASTVPGDPSRYLPSGAFLY